MGSAVTRGFRRLVGIRVDLVEPGTSTAHLTVTADHLNSGGILHGGAICTLGDSAMGHAVASLILPAQSAATATLNITFLARANEGDELIAQAKVRKRGKRIVVVDVVVSRVPDGVEIAHAISTFGTFDRRGRRQLPAS